MYLTKKLRFNNCITTIVNQIGSRWSRTNNNCLDFLFVMNILNKRLDVVLVTQQKNKVEIVFIFQSRFKQIARPPHQKTNQQLTICHNIKARNS